MLPLFWRYVSFFDTSASLLVSSFFEWNSVECSSAEDFFETLVILSVILLPIKSTVASTVLNYSFWRSFYCIHCRFFSAVKTFLTIFIAQMFFAKDKNPYLFPYIISLGLIEYLIFKQWNCIQWRHYLITTVKFIVFHF